MHAAHCLSHRQKAVLRYDEYASESKTPPQSWIWAWAVLTQLSVTVPVTSHQNKVCSGFVGIHITAELSWAELGCQGDWVKAKRRECGIWELQDISQRSRRPVTVVWPGHVVHYHSNNKPSLSCTRWVKTPGVRLCDEAADKRGWIKKPNSLSAASNGNKRSSSHQPDMEELKYAPSISVEQKRSDFSRVKTRVPVHLRLVSSLFEALRSLQSKFSSQNSANHTFLRLFSRVSPVKYSSNPGDKGRRRMAQFRTNYQPIQTCRKWSETGAELQW